jgi:competence protein ComEA
MSDRSCRVMTLWHRVRSGEDPLAFGAVVIVAALAAGFVWFWAGTHHGRVAAAEAAPEAARSESSTSPGGPPPVRPLPAGDSRATGRGSSADGASGPGADSLAVHVAGAVVHPGLYHLPAGARVADALTAAGGSVPRADLDRLNLAARVLDGQRVLVVRRGEPNPAGASPSAVDGGGVPGGSPEAPAEPVDLNTAGLSALDSLPGIGPATARAILEERARRGGFRSTRDLLRIPGIGEGRFARLKDRIRV